eukprot:gene11404-7909_t
MTAVETAPRQTGCWLWYVSAATPPSLGHRRGTPAHNINAAELRAITGAFPALQPAPPAGARILLHADNTSALRPCGLFRQCNAEDIRLPCGTVPYEITANTRRARSEPGGWASPAPCIPDETRKLYQLCLSSLLLNFIIQRKNHLVMCHTERRLVSSPRLPRTATTEEGGDKGGASPSSLARRGERMSEGSMFISLFILFYFPFSSSYKLFHSLSSSRCYCTTCSRYFRSRLTYIKHLAELR